MALIYDLNALLQQIETGKLSDKELTNLLNNANRLDVPVEDRELLIEAIELKMRMISPSKATKLFGNKDTDYREKLESFLVNLEIGYDLSKNKLENRVKTGGSVINGTAHIDVYISYKSLNQINLSIGFFQVDIDSEPEVYLRQKNLAVGEKSTLLSKKSGAENFDKLSIEFENLLKVMT